MAEVNKIEEAHVIEKKLITQNVKGSVKWFSLKNSFGFIHREDVDEDIFVHSSSIVRPKDQTSRYYLSVRQGESVKFDVVQGEKGFEAANVTGSDGEPLKSGEYSYWFRGRGQSRGMNGNVKNREESGIAPISRGDGVVPYQNEFLGFYRGRGGGRRPFYGGMFVRGGFGYHYPPYGFNMRGGFRGQPFYNGIGYNNFGPIIMAENMQPNRGNGRMGPRNRGSRSRGRGRGGQSNENFKDNSINGVQESG